MLGSTGGVRVKNVIQQIKILPERVNSFINTYFKLIVIIIMLFGIWAIHKTLTGLDISWELSGISDHLSHIDDKLENINDDIGRLKRW